MKNILYNSFCQAIIKLSEKSHISLKIILFLFIFVSTSLASYMVIEAILYYFTYDVTTTSRVLYERPAYFPKVTLCNQNMFTTEYAYEFAKSINSSWNIYTNKEKLNNMSYAERYDTRVYFYTQIHVHICACIRVGTYTQVCPKKVAKKTQPRSRRNGYSL